MIRYAKKEDVKSIYELICQLEDKTFDYSAFEMIYLNLFEDSNHHFLVNEDDGIDGLCHFYISYHLHHCDKVADIMELIVDEKKRSEGIGKKLLDYTKQIAKENDCEQIELDTNQKRKGAHKFYEREGLVNDHYNFVMKL